MFFLYIKYTITMSIQHTRTRFAPSPTGNLHIGSLRTAVYTYALAKKNGGQFILRLEDTDKKREVEGSAQKLYEVLKTFGLNWDEGPIVGGSFGPYIQSERLSLGQYKQAAEKLMSQGNAFYCFCKPQSKEEIKEGRKFKIEFRDPCRHLSSEQIQKNIAQGHVPAIRLKTPDNETISYTDFVLGKQTTWKTDVVDDAMLLKSDGFPTYHLAVVVDDTAMNITHVLRGHDWQPSTPIHLLIYKYLNIPVPQIGHLTDILNTDGKGKLSKRNNNVSCEQYLNDGYLPEALLNFVILLGWAPKDNQEMFTLEEFVSKFDPKGFQKSNPRFDQRKLDWLNGQYLRKKQDDILADQSRP
ncbi:glutamate--tRNA ligase, partial [Candidatus Collierbacteria bacterium RIFOXYD1_FULL_40_9]